MTTVTVHVAKTQLSRLLKRVEAGEDVRIARGKRPVARLVRVAPRRARRVLGAERDRVRIRGDLLAPLPAAIVRAFERR